ncbi:hypothetical protein BRADI_1g21903v3 [Brachypodium distachyon]|uniref:Uncharacterized protein n=1 Tax=Brachypodium distachyon TaxID=15368 RepID=A0A0Q3GWD3_BRADI|nr:hypothetical protein BRADI_1g21903v3 [Brachypodium distachyon]
MCLRGFLCREGRLNFARKERKRHRVAFFLHAWEEYAKRLVWRTSLIASTSIRFQVTVSLKDTCSRSNQS